MPVDLVELVGSGRSAVLTMEMQRGVVGDLSSFPELAEAVAVGSVIENTARLVEAARSNGVPVVHCTAGFRADRLGTPLNAPLIASVLRRSEHLLDDSDATRLVPELETPEAVTSDLFSHRRHGVSPFTGTSLDATLRALAVSTVVATGVSLNLGILGLAIEAVNLGYRVVLAADAVAGVPAEYCAAVMEHTLPLIARISIVSEIIAAFSG